MAFGCHQASRSDRFRALRSRLPTLPSTLVLRCGISDEMSSSSIDDTNYSEYIPQPCRAVGRLWPDQKYTTILYGVAGDDIYPFIMTFSEDGDPIDSRYVQVNCEGDPGWNASSTIYLSPQQIVTQIDTVYKAAVDSEFNEIPGTDSLIVLIRQHKIDDQGRIREIYTRREILHP